MPKTSLIWEKKESLKSRKYSVPYRMNPKRNTSRHIIIKITKIQVKERILKSAKKMQQITYDKTPRKPSANFSAETLQARREWHDLFKVMKEKKNL